MYSRLDVDATESEDDASEHGDPRSEIETSRPQCTSFRGVTAIIGRGAEFWLWLSSASSMLNYF